MKGDFSRGYNPDTKRGRSYRRVLLQQGRALLDSDLSALVDNMDQLIREGIRILGCSAGSSDLGYFVTPGRLLAMFDPRLGVDFRATGSAAAVRDYAHKYLDRLPGLRISTSNGAGTVEIQLRRTLESSTTIRMWVSAESPVSTTANGQAFSVPAASGYTAVEVQTAGNLLTLGVDPSAPYWIAMGPETSLLGISRGRAPSAF
jgi:hypothetical protein